MNCHGVRELAFEYVNGEVPFARELELRRHTSSCPDCRTYLRCLLEEEELLETALAPGRGSSRRARRIVRAVRGPSPSRVPFIPAVSMARGVAVFAGVSLLMLCALLAVMKEVSSPAAGEETRYYHPLASRPALQMRLGLSSPSKTSRQTEDNLTGVYADLYQIAAESLGTSTPRDQVEEPKDNPTGEKANPDRLRDGALVPSRSPMWKAA